MSIDFADIWQKYSKYSTIEVACFSFCVGLLFLSTFRLSNRTPKITQILKITPHTACQHGAIQYRPYKGDKISIKSLYKCKGYIAWQFITEFPDKGWTNSSINRLLLKLKKFGSV